MAEVVRELLELAGVGMAAPATFAEVLPYIINITISCLAVGGVFAVIGLLARTIFNWSRWVR